MKKLIKKIAKILIQLLSILRIEQILKYFSYLLVIKNTRNRYSNKSSNEINALVIEKSGFDIDLLPLQKSQNINLYLFPANLLMTIVQSVLSEELHCQIEYHFYNDIKSTKQKNKIEKLFLKILPYLVKKLNINVILVKNFDYFEHQDLCKAAKKINLKVAVIYCESVTTKYSANSFTEVKSIKEEIDFPFDLILVSGPDGKNLLIENSVCTENQVAITGYCRTDVIHNSFKDRGSHKQNLVVLFDFGFEDIVFYSDDGYGAPKLAYSATEEFGKLSKNFKNKYKFVIKTRTNKNTKKVYDHLKKFGINDDDITVTGSLKMEEVVNNAKLVIGYTSTTTLELFGTDIPFVLPYWFEAKQNSEEGNSFFESMHNPSYIPAESSGEYIEIITNILNDNLKTSDPELLSNHRKNFIYNYLYYIDGKASQRTFTSLKNLVFSSEK